ncbi:hypothetical protein HXX76_007668 [Chlamydomonas incerta]|uniref:Uncharacterized protein n=1 Tax=Chlamydomonas incerta TaxID=51695 RepID=A0A835SX80_CHLIN|nr:hypothetical protein HXX76_007668 [Chlamydomonas incerta]|eukprot:KAG2434783.1 hypothetical protein HXX76_007668 [Chlamydomonas incerta]
MQKTVVVAVSYVVWVPKYKVYQKRVARHKARDESQASVIGDIVRIRKSRKFSREVSYSVVDTLRKAHVYDPAAAVALVAARDAARTAAGTGSPAAAGAGQAAQLEGAGFAASGVISPGGAGRSDPWVAEAARRLDASAARLAALRELYDKEVGPGVPLSGAVLAVANSGPGGTGSVRGKAAAEGSGEVKATDTQ